MTAEQLQQLLASMQAQIDQLEQDLKTEKAVNEALRQQKTTTALPVAVKPSLPATFGGKIDGTTVSRFVHPLDTYFDLVDLKDDSKRGQIAVTLLEGPAYTWHSIQGNITGWVRLNAALLGYFKPADYAYKTKQSLAKWT